MNGKKVYRVADVPVGRALSSEAGEWGLIPASVDFSHFQFK